MADPVVLRIIFSDASDSRKLHLASGIPETGDELHQLHVNSLKHKREGQGKAAANIKKPRRAEVNYIPLHPKGETAESLENERMLYCQN